MRAVLTDIHTLAVVEVRDLDGALPVADLPAIWLATAQPVQVGDMWRGDDPATFGPPPSPPVPEVVTMRLAKRALHAAGLLAQVDGLIDAMPEPARGVARIDWEYATEVHRASELVALLGPALGLDAAAVDALFVAAAEV